MYCASCTLPPHNGPCLPRLEDALEAAYPGDPDKQATLRSLFQKEAVSVDRLLGYKMEDLENLKIEGYGTRKAILDWITGTFLFLTSILQSALHYSFFFCSFSSFLRRSYVVF